jgi:hypothetical protein
MRYRLRTLLILLAIGPPLLVGALWLCATEQKPMGEIILLSGDQDWEPWYPPGSPQAASLGS